jgi:hypothetical protein
VGAVEVRLRIGGGGVRAGVVTPPGTLTERAETTLPELLVGLERATGLPAAASVTVRPGSAPPPAPPAGAFDGYA